MLSRQFILGESNGHSSLEMTVSVSEAYKESIDALKKAGVPIHTHHGLHHIYFSARPRHLNPGDQQGIRPRNKILAASRKDIPAPVVYAEKPYDYHVCRSGKPVSKALYRIFPQRLEGF